MIEFNKHLLRLFSCLIGAQLTLLYFVVLGEKKKETKKKQKELMEFAKGSWWQNVVALISNAITNWKQQNF